MKKHFFALLLLSTAFYGFGAVDGPLHMAIYPKEGVPGPGNQPYPPSIIIKTGDTLPLTAKVFDRLDVWLSQFESDAAPITWKLVALFSSDSIGSLASTSGFKTSFIATRSYYPWHIIATLDGYYASDTIIVDVVPRPRPNHLVIEPSPNSLIKSPNSDDRLGIMTIGCKDVFKSAYAVIRDVYGNYVSHSEKTVWQSRDTSVADVAQGDSLLGEGIIKCKKYGNAWIFARDSSLGTAIFDSVQAECAGPCPRLYRLQIVKDDSVPLESLTLTLGSSVTLRAQAARVDSAECVNVSAYWTFPRFLDQPPVVPESPPAYGNSWTFSPVDTGSGWIKIDVPFTWPDSIPVTAIPATRANGRTGNPVLKIMLGNRSFSVPRDVKIFSITGFDLRGRILFRQDKRISGNQFLQSNTDEFRHSGIALFIVSFYNAQGKVLSEEKFKSISFR